MEDCNLAECLQRYHNIQKEFNDLLIVIIDNSKIFIENYDFKKLNEKSYNSELSETKSHLLKSLDNIADWAINLEDSKLYLEFTSILRTILKHKVVDFNKNYILYKKESKYNQKLLNDHNMLVDICSCCRYFLHVLEGLANLTKNLAENPTKQLLKEIIKDLNNNVGLYRKWILDGLDRLNIAREI